MLNLMVKYSDNRHGEAVTDRSRLDRTFAALADPTRRALIARLSGEPGISVSALAAPFSMSLPAVMKHLDVLAEAGLLAREKAGRTVACRLEAAPMREAVAWLEHYERFWSEALDRLTLFLEEEDQWTPPSNGPPSNPASPSSGALKRHRPKSSAPGPSRKK
jgi:DNA-binding transcriptional ArsR family regulator